jgi:hypothetical protein
MFELAPNNAHKKMPGNIGEGITKDNPVNIKKKTMRINAPRIKGLPILYNVVIFNKHIEFTLKIKILNIEKKSLKTYYTYNEDRY